MLHGAQLSQLRTLKRNFSNHLYSAKESVELKDIGDWIMAVRSN